MGDVIELEEARIVARIESHVESFRYAASEAERRLLMETFCHEHDALAERFEREAAGPAPRPWVAEVAAELRRFCAAVRGALAKMKDND